MPLRPVRFLSLFVIAVLVGAAPALRAADAIESLQTAATEWARLRSETARLQSDWEWQRELMSATLTALQERIRTLENRRELIAARSATSRRSAEALASERAALAAEWATIEARLQQQCDALLHLRPWLPPRLAAALELPLRSVGDAALPPAERLQYVVVVLSRCAQFNQSITFTEETLALAGDENPRLVEVLYWGLSHGYALDRARDRAYVGFPGRDGWTWEERESGAPAVARLLAIHQDKAPPDFVVVPARLHDPFGGTSAEGAGR